MKGSSEVIQYRNNNTDPQRQVTRSKSDETAPTSPTRKPPRNTRSNRTTRREMKKQLQESALSKMQISLRENTRSNSRASPSPSLRRRPRNVDSDEFECDLEQVVQKVASTSSLLVDDDDNMISNQQALTPITTPSPAGTRKGHRPERKRSLSRSKSDELSPREHSSGSDSNSNGSNQPSKPVRTKSPVSIRDEHRLRRTISLELSRTDEQSPRRHSADHSSSGNDGTVTSNTPGRHPRSNSCSSSPSYSPSSTHGEGNRRGRRSTKLPDDSQSVHSDTQQSVVSSDEKAATKKHRKPDAPRRRHSIRDDEQRLSLNAESNESSTAGTAHPPPPPPAVEALFLSPPKPKGSRSLGLRNKEGSQPSVEKGERNSLSNTSGPATKPDANKDEDEATRGRRFGLPRITKSLTSALRTNKSAEDFSQAKDEKRTRRSRSPSLTTLFRMGGGGGGGGDNSCRSTTQRTASTASTEQSSLSYDESHIPSSPSVRSEDDSSGRTFSKLWARIRAEVEIPFATDSESNKESVCPLPAPRRDLPPTGRTGKNVRPPRPETNRRLQAKDDEENDIESIGEDGSSKVSKKKSSSTCRPRDVGFSTVTVREYARSIGDNPSVGAGTPIGLDWAYAKPSTMPVDYFEKKVRKAGDRSRQDFYLTEEQRFHLLLDEWGHTVEEIMAAKKVAMHIRYLRQVSLFGEAQLAAMAAAERRASTRAQRQPVAC